MFGMSPAPDDDDDQLMSLASLLVADDCFFFFLLVVELGIAFIMLLSSTPMSSNASFDFIFCPPNNRITLISSVDALAPPDDFSNNDF